MKHKIYILVWVVMLASLLSCDSPTTKTTRHFRYVSDTGETIAVSYIGAKEVEVHFMEVDSSYFKAFRAVLVESASGAKYESKDGRFFFWNKGEEASILDNDGQSIFSGKELKRKETIYYSEVFKTWRDELGECHTCTPENGFGVDGVVDNIAWRELWVNLKNDANEDPSIDEVRAFFQNFYAEKSGYYPVHVGKLKGVYSVSVPMPKELKDVDFFDRKGHLLATYDVIEHQWGETDPVFVRHSSIDPGADEIKARAYAENTEIYIQDGHSLRLRNPQLLRCSSCYDYVFDHYGDPGVPYYISVRVEADGSVVDMPE